jgi:flagellar protein FlaI
MDAVVVMTSAKMAGKNVRRVKEVSEIMSVTDAGASINKPYIWNPGTDSFNANAESHIFREIVAQHGMSMESLITEYNNRSKLLLKMYEQKILEFYQVQEVINEYYKDPETVLKKFGVI